MAARRKRFCFVCKTIGVMDENSRFTCLKCGTPHLSNITAPRLFDKLMVLAGRGSGKTLIGAHAVREELMVPQGITWVLGPTYKILHDSTFPTLIRRVPPGWVRRWDPEHTELILQNGHLLAFRSLEDPERARGPHGVTCGWFDEAAQSPDRAYDVFKPTLLKASGIVIATTTPFGFDWTYDKLEKPATIYKEPGYYFIKYWSEENPIFRLNPTAMQQIEQDRKMMSPDFFAQEYRAERRNATGLVYDFSTVEKQVLVDAAAVKAFIPEWPSIDPSRPMIIGLDSGADHPFGAVLIVATEFGLIVVAEYLERMRALSQHLPAITLAFNVMPGMANLKWAANKNEAQLRLEFGLKNVGVIPAESKHEIGIQRVQSWMHTGQLYFAYTAPRTIDQFKTYRYAANIATDGQKKKEQVFKFQDELPDAVRYALMAWPELPQADKPTMTDREKARWGSLSEQSRYEITKMRAMQEPKDELMPAEQGYPVGDFFGGEAYVD